METVNEKDELFNDAAIVMVKEQQASTSIIQRRLKLGYNRAGRIMEQLTEAGVVKGDIMKRTLNFTTGKDLCTFLNIPFVESEWQTKPEIVCYCGSLRVAMDAFKKAEYEAVMKGEIALLPCCMYVDIQREFGAESDYKQKADDLHKRKIDLCDRVVVLNVGGYIGESTRSEINYAIEIGKRVSYLEDAF